MSTRKKRIVTKIAIVGGIVAILGITRWLADPDQSVAGPNTWAPSGGGGPAPDVSITFVLDSSTSMRSASGADYFELAKFGVADFLDLPGMPTDSSWEIAVIQFTKLDAPSYDNGVHWIGPSRVTAGNRDAFADCIERLRPTGHVSGNLLEMGIREATSFYEAEGASEAVAGTTSRHIIILSTGEYRLPQPYPPECYSVGSTPCAAWTCVPPTVDGIRTCQIREFAELALALDADPEADIDGVRISTLQLGRQWNPQGEDCYTSTCNPPPDPPDPNYCNEPDTPPRDEFLKEIANVDNCNSGANWPVGNNARINPFTCFGCGIEDFVPGTARDISATIAQWMCDWGVSLDSDGDSYDDICDNCPSVANERQRDCNRDGVGDLCQPECDSVPDDDLDGLCDVLDTCPGGDDCLVAMWTEGEECADYETCGCDCDHDGAADACQVAQDTDFANATLPYDDKDVDPLNGIPDYCDDGFTDPLCEGVPLECKLSDDEWLEDFDGLTDLPAEWWEPAGQTVVSIVNDVLVVATGTTGTSARLDGPGIFLPEWQCDPEGLICHSVRRDPDWHETGVIKITMNIKIEVGDPGSWWDLYVLDPCEGSLQDSTRTRVRFFDHPPSSSGGLVYWEAPCILCGETGFGGLCCGDPAFNIPEFPNLWWNGQVYEPGEWFSLEIYINAAAPYDVDSGTGKCRYDWEYSVEGRVNGAASFFDQDEVNVKPFVHKNAQIVIVTSDMDSTFYIDDITIAITDYCTWESNGTQPCDEEANETCECVNQNWSCQGP